MIQEAWDNHWGTEYRRDLREMDLQPLLIELETKQLLGNVVVDVGSGKFPVTAYLRHPHKVIQIDIAGEDGIDGDTLHLRKDIQLLAESSDFGTQRALLRMARFLEINPRRDSSEQADSIIFSQVLNYVDYQQVLVSAQKYLKPGGLIIIVNQPGLGYTHLFSPKGIKANSDLTGYLDELGLTVTRQQYPWNKNGSPPTEKSMLIIVAEKKREVVEQIPTPKRDSLLSYLRSAFQLLAHQS